MQLGLLEKQIGYTFRDKDYVKEALTHRSYLNERPAENLSHNERLEFLGDAVLELVVTEELFKRYPDYTEGQLTPIRSALVNYQIMAEMAADIELEKFIMLSRGEAKGMERAREVILANAMEALIGAVYLDGGYPSAKTFIMQFVMNRLEDVMKRGLYRDAKSVLQEKIQENEKVTPTYQVLSEEGPDHEKIFTVGVYYSEKLIAKGKGYSKQEAEVEAAKSALTKL